ncbi:MAG: substrate-binding periplasmic protein [Dongiaceae bacterium]
MKPAHYLTVILIAFLAAIVAQKLFPVPSEAAQKTAIAEPAYERLAKTGTLRCGYIVAPPLFLKDPNSGKFSGIGYDIVTEAAQLMNWKIEWIAESSFGALVQDLQSYKFDMLCTPSYIVPNRIGRVQMSKPLYYSGINAYVRVSDTRFDNNLPAINRPDVTISAVDGTTPMLVASTDFPQSKLLSLPQNSPYTDSLLNVANNKADVTFVETSIGEGFLQANPGVLRNITAEKPLRVYPDVFVFPPDEIKMKNLFDAVFAYMHSNGQIDRILDKNSQTPGEFYRLPKAFKINE